MGNFDSIERFAKNNETTAFCDSLRGGLRKDDIAKQQRKQFHKPEGMIFIGKAQRKCWGSRTEKRHNQQIHMHLAVHCKASSEELWNIKMTRFYGEWDRSVVPL